MSELRQNSTKGTGCLIIFLASLSLYQIFFALRVFNNVGLYTGHLSMPPALQIGIAIVWAILFITALLRLVMGKSHAVGYSACLMISFVVFALLQTIFFAQADYERKRIPFLVVGTILILIAPVLLLLRRKTQGAEQ